MKKCLLKFISAKWKCSVAILSIFNILIFISSAIAQEKTELKCHRNIDGAMIEISISKTEFIEKIHNIQKMPNGQFIIDGQKPIGTPVIPHWEISDFLFSLNGKDINIPESSYKDCYEINLNGMTIIPAKDPKEFMIHMNGSDGAYAYDVYWIIDHEKFRNRYIWQNQDQFLPNNMKTECTD